MISIRKRVLCMSIDLGEVISAIQNAGEGIAFYYWPDREMIVFDCPDHPDDEVPVGFDFQESGNGLISLPSPSTKRDYERMKMFAETSDGQKKEWLMHAIQGAGAFRRFRVVLERFGIVEEWYAFCDQCDRALAVAWCEEHGVPYHLEEEEDAPSTEKKAPKFAFRIIKIGEKNVARAAVLKAAVSGSLEMATLAIDDLLRQGGILFAAVQNGRYIGYIQIESGNIVTDIYVADGFRRMKIGTGLVERGQEECGSLCVHVPYGNEAAADFFAALGYCRKTFIALMK